MKSEYISIGRKVNSESRLGKISIEIQQEMNQREKNETVKKEMIRKQIFIQISKNKLASKPELLSLFLECNKKWSNSRSSISVVHLVIQFLNKVSRETAVEWDDLEEWLHEIAKLYTDNKEKLKLWEETFVLNCRKIQNQ